MLCAELSSYRKEMPDQLRRELQQHSEVIQGKTEFSELRKELQAVGTCAGLLEIIGSGDPAARRGLARRDAPPT